MTSCQQVRPVREIENVFIPLADGTRLATRIWLPENADEAPVPAVLEFLPYRKRDEMAARDERLHPFVAAHGYACARVDMRGSGDSDGVLDDEYSRREQADCIQVIEWLAAQEWCSGAVGMMGISWSGFNALQVAALAPAALKAVIAVAASDDRFADDIHYMGGCLLTSNFTWAQKMLADLSRPPDPAVVGERWREMWLQRLDAAHHLIEPWLTHQHRDEYWRHASICEDYGAIRCPVLAVGGWADSYVNFVARLVRNLASPCKGITGPWAHDYPHTASPGPAIGFLQGCVRWWDQWLKGIDRGLEAEPDWRVYLQEDMPVDRRHAHRKGGWIGVDKTALVRRQDREFHLARDGLVDAPPADHVLEHRSLQTVGSRAGEWCASGAGDLPADQGEDDERSLCFETGLLKEDLCVLGGASVVLDMTAEQAAGSVIARLEDVSPDGRSARVTYGVFNLARSSEPENGGGRRHIAIALTDTAYRFRAGHRIRLALSTAYWPTIWPGPRNPRIAIHAPESRLRLPLLTEGMIAGRPVSFEPALVPEAQPRETLRTRTSGRVLEREGAGNETIIVENDFGSTRILSHGLTFGMRSRESYSIKPDDPLTAKVESHWHCEMGRGDWQVSTETTGAMTSSEHAFHISATLFAFEGGVRIFARTFEFTIPRKMV